MFILDPTRQKRPAIDRLNAKILNHLQADGRLTSVEMSERIHLSQSATARRMSWLRERGLIARVVTVVDAKALGYPVRVVLWCSLDRATPDAHVRFREALHLDPQVADADLVAGGADFVLSVRARSMDDYARWLADYHDRFPGLRDVKSFPVLDECKRAAPLPVEAAGAPR